MSITHNTHGKTSGKFALTKAVSCLQNSVTHTQLIYVQRRLCFVYNDVTHMIYWHNIWILMELFFDVLSLSLFIGSSLAHLTFNAFFVISP